MQLDCRTPVALNEAKQAERDRDGTIEGLSKVRIRALERDQSRWSGDGKPAHPRVAAGVIAISCTYVQVAPEVVWWLGSLSWK